VGLPTIPTECTQNQEDFPMSDTKNWADIQAAIEHEPYAQQSQQYAFSANAPDLRSDGRATIAYSNAVSVDMLNCLNQKNKAKRWKAKCKRLERECAELLEKCSKLQHKLKKNEKRNGSGKNITSKNNGGNGLSSAITSGIGLSAEIVRAFNNHSDAKRK
jgi:hypothetical protein